MPAVVTSSVVRSILSTNINLSADDVIRKAKDKGVTAPEASIRTTIYNIKSELKKKAAKGANAPKPVPAAARTTSPKPAPKSTTPAVSAPTPDLSSILANVALVNTVVDACGGIEPARKVAEAVRACGGVEAFLQHLDLVAKVRGEASA
jgi:hypothetical protein